MKNIASVTISALALVFGFACSGDNGAPESTTSLNAGEQAALANALVLAVNESVAAVNGPTSPKLSAIAQFDDLGSTTVAETVDCPLGGSIDIAGENEFDLPDLTNASSLEDDFSSFGFSLDNDYDYRSCIVEDESNSRQLTLNGSLNSSGSFTFDISGEDIDDLNISGSIRTVGGIDVEGAEAGDGTCGIELTTSITSTGGTQTGNVCGEEVNEIF